MTEKTKHSADISTAVTGHKTYSVHISTAVTGQKTKHSDKTTVTCQKTKHSADISTAVLVKRENILYICLLH